MVHSYPTTTDVKGTKEGVGLQPENGFMPRVTDYAGRERFVTETGLRMMTVTYGFLVSKRGGTQVFEA